MTQAPSELVPAVDRAIRMLASLHDVQKGQRISDLARRLDIPKSSAFQIAATLVHHGMLERDADTRRYRLGPGVSHLAWSGRAEADLTILARPYLRELAHATRMTATLGLRVADGIVLAARSESPEPIDVSVPIGHRLSGRAGVFGKLLAAALEPEALDRFLREPLPRFTRRSITDAAAFRKELRGVRKLGYGRDVGEYLDGVTAVGSAVLDAAGDPVAGLCLLGLSASIDRRRLAAAGRAARSAAQDLSADLGFEATGRAGGARR